MQYRPILPHGGAGTRGDKSSGGRNKALACGEGCVRAVRAQNRVGGPMPAVHFERLLESVDTKGACNQSGPTDQPRAQSTLSRHLFTNEAINGPDTQHEEIGGEATQNTDDQPHEKHPDQFKAQLLWGCRQE